MRFIILAVFLLGFTAACGGGSKEESPPVSRVAGASEATPTTAPAAPTPVPPTPTPAPVLATCSLMPAGLPDANRSVRAPADSVAANLKALSGAWEGRWGGTNPSVLIVNTVTATEASASYVFNNVLQQGAMVLMPQPDGKFKSSNGAFTWALLENGTLQGELVQNGQVTGRVFMTKC